MNPYGFYIIIHIAIALFLPYALSKSLLERTEIDSETIEKDRSEAVHEAHHHGLRYGKESRLKKHRRGRASVDDQNEKEYAIMYKNQEPVGILQRFHDSYQLLPLRSEDSIPVDVSPVQRLENEETRKRDIEDDEVKDKNDNAAQFADEKYPYIFAKFKIDTKVEKENQKSRTLEKREIKPQKKKVPLFNEEHVNSLNSALSRLETNDDKAEVELRGILHDMGLIEEPHFDKREAELAEDENLEHGTNKIDLIKIENKPPAETAKNQPVKRSEKASTKHYEMIQYPEPKPLGNEEQEIEEFIHKHPEEFKQRDKEREKRSDDVQEQMEKRIKERLQKIKEEVRSEIDKLKAGNRDDNDEEEEEEEGSRVDSEEEGKAQRRKRNIISSLIEEETSDLNPVIVADENPVPHVRRRRSVALQHDGSLGVDNLGEDLETTTSSQYIATTENHFLQRNLLEFSDDGADDNVDFQADEEEDSPLQREKKGCKCEGGKDCKCGKPKASMAGPDGVNFVYFDGAPMLINAPYGPAPGKVISGPLLDLGHDTYRAPSKQNKRYVPLKDGAYRLDIKPDSYQITEDKNQWLQSRRKRNSFLDLVAIHGGAPALDHLVAIRERSMVPRMRSKRTAAEKEKPKQLTLIDMSENDIFGAVPEGFEGDELARFKRVKREA